jgi:pimeloyl-ACP methyl ester carboxylesterase
MTRAGLARRERMLLAGGLALVTVHLLDLAISGPDTSWLGLLAIVALPAAWYAAWPRLLRPTRIGLAFAIGLLSIGFGTASHGLHVVNSGPDLRDLTGVGLIAGGLLLLASAVSALAGSARPRFRPVRTVAWLAGAAAMAMLVLVPLLGTLLITHAPRWAIQEASLDIPHEEVRVGDGLAAWWVPPRNGAAVLLMHGSGGSRERVAAHVRMLARHGYGVLALDLPGNGESDGHSNGLGDNAQPAVDAALGWMARRSDRVAGYGLSLGAEVLLEAAAREPRLRAVVSDGAGRPRDGEAATHAGADKRLMTSLQLLGVRAVSGMRTSPSLNPLVGRIAPRPVLLVASGGFPEEIPANRVYHRLGGPTTELWELPAAAHTGGLRSRPAEYERRVIAFLDRALAP